ncbi:lasso peptide biosynthesis B2 protein [Stackebrandtia nassauensis]|uniref:Microcin J25-processing protein McjB C-terminal domain-containing protein n=1 Tax=Stackebrandtia nassauensis (strain DSM 44728 / CIP 108903 / NRRL B-16338 / NBRC 102104 / LLR-40K-21) TaxID=446470 RepID=D3Q2F8_STANL|nr:lasso peptide biosynthesis B2 protein [Stackebrandtia nassauensis]ADD43891.1 hypothetical protein Snas_4242 [Stackebrandtia nassauensis DSM 44728]
MTAIMSTTTGSRVSWLLRLAAVAVMFAVSIAVRLIAFHRTRSIARRLSRPAVRPASERQAVTVLAAIDAACRWVPVRAACLERSIAAVVLLRLRRRRVEWCHGIKTQPVALHAWIQVDGRPVGEPADPTTTYNVLFTTHHHEGTTT